MVKGKKILLGITGSIAAYKAILLIRLLVKNGAEIKVVITPAALDFVTPLTLSTLSKNKVLCHLADEDAWANHVMLGRWADVMVIAPASCNTLAKMVAGLCDNLLLAAYLSATCPVVIVPAMDEDMWHHGSTINNINALERFGNYVISVNKGELASGLFGEGRMAEPEDIVVFLEEKIFRKQILNGKKAIVTAGPTYESIDPVRFIGNHSSGKMGFAIAEALYKMGADVQLIVGPVHVKPRYKGIHVITVSSAQEMYEAATTKFVDADIAVMAAAVADFAPEIVSDKKIKKDNADLVITLTKTKDILKTIGTNKKKHQIVVGFALETHNEAYNALKKLREKNADLMVLNSLNDSGAGFGKETNKITVFDRDGSSTAFETKSKKLVAGDIVELIIKKLNVEA